jgi:PPP family 3-phenylpropionic acid transporter
MLQQQTEKEEEVLIRRFFSADSGYTSKYSLIHICYWPAVCSSFAFGAVFFLSKGYTNSQVGIVLAAASILAVLMQPVAASFADKSARISMKQLILLMTVASALLAAGRFFCSDIPVIPAILYILEQGLSYSMQPLLNALGVRVMNGGAKINFGLSRGTGSLAYAVVSIALGLFLRNSAPDALPLFSVLFYLFLALAVAKFPLPENQSSVNTSRRFGSGEEDGGETVKVRRKLDVRFILLLAAVVLVFCSQNMIGNYLIQIMKNVGGSADSVGISNGISAAVELPAMALFTFLVKKFRSSTLLRVSLAIFVCKAAATMLAPSVGALYLVQCLQFGGYAMFIPSSVYYANEVIPKERLATGQAALTSASTCGSVVASILGGWLLDNFNVGVMLRVGVLVSATGCAVGIAAVKTVKRVSSSAA